MNGRQTMPKQWLIIAGEPDWQAVRRLPRESGVLLLHLPCHADWRRLRNIGRMRSLTILVERPAIAARVHDVRELRRALLRRPALILLSPIHWTRSHSEWTQLPRMRAAALARLAGRRAVALGGMNHRRYANIAPLGFIAWAGISAFRT